MWVRSGPESRCLDLQDVPLASAALVLLDKVVCFLVSLLLQAASITHMHMCLPLTLSSADLCKGPRGKVEILLRLLRGWPALERVSTGEICTERWRLWKRKSSVTEPNRAALGGQE